MYWQLIVPRQFFLPFAWHILNQKQHVVVAVVVAVRVVVVAAVVVVDDVVAAAGNLVAGSLWKMVDSAIVEVGGDSRKPAVDIGHVVVVDVVVVVAAAVAIDGIAVAAEVDPIAVVGMAHLLREEVKVCATSVGVGVAGEMVHLPKREVLVCAMTREE